jgi:hypothetical protein
MPTTSDLLHYNYWINTSERLRLAAEEIFILFETRYDKSSEMGTIWEDNELILGLMQAYMLTISFGVENLLKGYCIFNFQKSNSLISVKSVKELEKQLWGSKNGHDLLKISECGGLLLSADESKMLARLQHYSIWAGRYHTPKHEHEMRELMKGEFVFATYASERRLIATLFGKVKKRLPQ